MSNMKMYKLQNKSDRHVNKISGCKYDSKTKMQRLLLEHWPTAWIFFITNTQYKAGMVHSGWTRGVQVKLWDRLRTRAIPEHLRGVFMTRHYTNPPLPLPGLQLPSKPHRPTASAKSYCLVTEAHVCEQLAPSHYMKVEWPEVKPMIHHATQPSSTHNDKCDTSSSLDYAVHTFCLSLIEPLPRTIILQPVSFSSCLAVRPRGPSIRPTKLNCHVHTIMLLTKWSTLPS